MDYEISIYEYGVKEYLLTFKNRDIIERVFDIISEFNISGEIQFSPYYLKHIFNMFINEEEYEIYIICNESHINKIKEVLNKKLNLNGSWV